MVTQFQTDRNALISQLQSASASQRAAILGTLQQQRDQFQQQIGQLRQQAQQQAQQMQQQFNNGFDPVHNNPPPSGGGSTKPR